MSTEVAITLENLPSGQREIAEVIGIENYLKLAKYVNGDTIYIAKYNEVLRPIRDATLQDSFDGYNFKELADKYDLCVRTIYNKVPKEIRVRKKNQPMDGQISF